MRSIVHIYIPSFHAAVEQLRKPELAGKPVVVTHRSGGTEFIISASPEAKAEGVREGMTVRHAGRYCPNGMFVPADWGVYKDKSDQVLDILAGYTPLLEPHWLDRAYMDLTGCRGQGVEGPRDQGIGTFNAGASNGRRDASLPRCPERSTFKVQRIIWEETGLVVSAGIAQNKLVAQAAASVCKAGECVAVEPGKEGEFLAPLMVGHLPGVGPKIEKRLMALGVATIGELAAIPCPMLVRQFGTVGSKLHRLAQGIDFSPVKALYPPETIIIEHAFDSIADMPSEPEEAIQHLGRMSERASRRLRQRNQKSGAVSLRLEFDDGNVCLRSYVPKSPISSLHEIYSAARRIVRQEMYGTSIVSMRLTLGDLRAVGGFQLNFLEDTERKLKLQAVLANIHSKFGERAIVYGTTLCA